MNDTLKKKRNNPHLAQSNTRVSPTSYLAESRNNNKNKSKQNKNLKRTTSPLEYLKKTTKNTLSPKKNIVSDSGDDKKNIFEDSQEETNMTTTSKSMIQLNSNDTDNDTDNDNDDGKKNKHSNSNQLFSSIKGTFSRSPKKKPNSAGHVDENNNKPISPNSRHQVVVVQSQPFQEFKSNSNKNSNAIAISKTPSGKEQRQVREKNQSNNRSQSSQTRRKSAKKHQSKSLKKSKEQQQQHKDASSENMPSTFQKQASKRVSRRAKKFNKGKRHSMQPLTSNQIQRQLKQRSGSKKRSGPRSSETAISSDNRQDSKKIKSRHGNTTSDMSAVSGSQGSLKMRKAVSHVDESGSGSGNIGSSTSERKPDKHSNYNKYSGKKHKHVFSGQVPTSSSATNLNEEETTEQYIKKRDKLCKFRIKNEIFEIYDYYKPIRLCGSGAYAVVCEAIDTRTKKKVAIKKNKHIFDDIRDARRILREIKLLMHYQSKKHPDIIELYDTLPPPFSNIDDFDDVYCVMPLLETNLCKIITSKQPLTNLHYQYLTYQILRGLKYIHSSGVIHRDIKPENILLNGSDCDVKVIDFGLARGVSIEEDVKKEARTEYVCTRWYRSPEVMCSGGHYDAKMDIWGVGCIMAEMILRNPLFPGQNYLDQLQKIFDTMGTPKAVDWILNDQAKAWVKKLRKHNGKNLRAMIKSKFDNKQDLDNCVDLLHKLLQLNPVDRISSADSLLHPYFKDIHDEDECFDAPLFDLSFEFEKSIKTKFGVRHMMYEALNSFHNERWAKIKKRKKKKRHKSTKEEKL